MRVVNVLLVAAGLALAWIALRHTLDAGATAPEIQVPSRIPVALTGEVPDGYVVRAFDVQGMCCDSCAAKLYAPLAAIDGVDEIAIDPLSGRVATLVPADLDVGLLTAALNRDDYSARPVE